MENLTGIRSGIGGRNNEKNIISIFDEGIAGGDGVQIRSIQNESGGTKSGALITLAEMKEGGEVEPWNLV